MEEQKEENKKFKCVNCGKEKDEKGEHHEERGSKFCCKSCCDVPGAKDESGKAKTCVYC